MQIYTDALKINVTFPSIMGEIDQQYCFELSTS